MDFFPNTFLMYGDSIFWVLMVKLAESFQHKLISSYAEKFEKCLSFMLLYMTISVCNLSPHNGSLLHFHWYGAQ